MVNKELHGNDKVSNKSNQNKKEEIVYKYSNSGKGPLRESVIIAGIPYFMKKSFNEKRAEDYITVEPYIDKGTKLLRPPSYEECPYIPYEFNRADEPNQYLQRAKKENINYLYDKIKSLASLFNDVDENTLNLLTADILCSYFQDRCSTLHYLFVLGDNGTGKSVFGDTFECLGYRAVNITNATEAFWFRVFGTKEAGQVTIIAEEFDRIDENTQVMGMLKEGYHPNAKVPRMNNENTKLDFYLPFGLKIMIAEKSPGEDKAKGLLDRSLTIQTYKGIPKCDIKEIRNPQGNKQRQQILDQIIDLRKLLLAFKLIHFNDPLPEVDVGLNGREKELCKPLLQLFYGLGASKETLCEIENSLKHFLDIKNNRKEHSREALVYPIIANIISKYGNEISTTMIWDSITNSLAGYFDTYVDKEGVEQVKNPNLYQTLDYGAWNRNSAIRMIRDKFGAEMKHKETGNVLIFNPNHFLKAGKLYGKAGAIRTRLAIATDSPDSPDAPIGSLKKSMTDNHDKLGMNGEYLINNFHETQDLTTNINNGTEQSDLPSVQDESGGSGESVTKSDYPPHCYYCDRVFDGIGKRGYERHVIQKHSKMPCYPGIADKKLYNLKSQGMWWEGT